MHIWFKLVQSCFKFDWWCQSQNVWHAQIDRILGEIVSPARKVLSVDTVIMLTGWTEQKWSFGRCWCNHYQSLAIPHIQRQLQLSLYFSCVYTVHSRNSDSPSQLCIGHTMRPSLPAKPKAWLEASFQSIDASAAATLSGQTTVMLKNVPLCFGFQKSGLVQNSVFVWIGDSRNYCSSYGQWEIQNQTEIFVSLRGWLFVCWACLKHLMTVWPQASDAN